MKRLIIGAVILAAIWAGILISIINNAQALAR